MSGQVSASPSAVEAAAGLAPGSDVPWRALEIAAFTPHPRVQDGLDPRGRLPRAGGRPPAARRGVVAVVVLATLGLPLLGLVAVAVRGRRWEPGQDPLAVDVAAGAYAVSALALVVLLVRLVPAVARRRDVPPAALPVFAVPAVLAGLTLLLTPVRDVGALDARLLPVWSTVLVAAAGAVLAVVGRGPRGPRVPPGPLVVARAAVARLTDAERAAVAADLAAAVDDLEARGVVEPGLAARARAAPLAMLAHDLSQGRR